MEKSEISQLANQMQEIDDLLVLLNKIKKEKLVQMGFSAEFHPFTLKHIHYYANPNHTFHRYKQFKIKKKTGGYRLITAPRNRSYMLLLECLNEILKAIYTPSENAMGFTEGRSIADNANVHKGMNYVLNLDLKDFFPSIAQARIWKRIQVKPFNFPTAIANTIAGLCCMKEMREVSGEEKAFYVLPQGAPTSPILTNIICDKLDYLLTSVAKRFGLNYTRYADDITFSSMHNVYAKDGEFIKEVKRIITNQNFIINDKKTRLQKKGSRQEVTGITVNEKLNVAQKYVRNIRNLLYIWKKYGYNVAYNRFFVHYKREKGHIKKGNPDLINVIEGKLLFLKMIKGEKDSVYRKLNQQFIALSEMQEMKDLSTSKGITYIETLSISEFEKKNNTEIRIVKKGSPRVNGNGETVSKRYAYFTLGEEKVFISISKYVTEEEENHKNNLDISVCLDKDKKPFWIIHHIKKHNTIAIKTVNIDQLNKDLDSLLGG